MIRLDSGNIPYARTSAHKRAHWSCLDWVASIKFAVMQTLCPFCYSSLADADGSITFAQQSSDGKFVLRCPRCQKSLPVDTTAARPLDCDLEQQEEASDSSWRDIRSQQRVALHGILGFALPLGGAAGFALVILDWYFGKGEMLAQLGWIPPATAAIFLAMNLIFDHLAKRDIGRLARFESLALLKRVPDEYLLVPTPSSDYNAPLCCALCGGASTKTLETTVGMEVGSSSTAFQRARFKFCKPCAAIVLHLNAAIRIHTASMMSIVLMTFVGLLWAFAVQGYRDLIPLLAVACVVALVIFSRTGNRNLVLPPIYAVQTHTSEGRKLYLGFASKRFAEEFAQLNGLTTTPWLAKAFLPVHPFFKSWTAFTLVPGD
jgi:hypothetical protein